MVKIKFVCISDIHGRVDDSWWLNLPPGDFLIIAGDLLKNYSPLKPSDVIGQRFEIQHLDSSVFSKLKYKHILLCAGNHDFLFEKDKEIGRYLRNCIYKEHESVIAGGFKFHLFPSPPRFYDWAFNVDRNSHKMNDLLNRIPDDVEVLISHGPPHGILDYSENSGMHVGCEQMARRIKELPNLRLHIFGHIHGGYGIVKKEMWAAHGQPVIFANASVCNEKYQPLNSPHVIEIEK